MLKAKTDNNHKLILKALRDAGFVVFSTHRVGQGFPDAVASLKGRTILIEIKDGSKSPSKRKLTPDEQKFHDSWQDTIYIIGSVSDVIELRRKFY